MGTKKIYLKFIKWNGEYAIFKEASLIDCMAAVVLTPMSGLMTLAGVGIPFIIKAPDGLKKRKLDIVEETENERIENDTD